MVLGLDIDARKAQSPGLHPFELKGGILYGPIPSRRLGFSLGVNLLPMDVKVCTWDCLYCQCGWTDRTVDQARVDPARFPSIAVLSEAFEGGFEALAREGKRPGSITLSGNGEPTLHPRFEEAVDALIRARDRHLPEAKTSILSNGERIGEPSVRAALDRLDQRCMKLDAGDAGMTEKIDRPLTPFDLDAYVGNLKRLKPLILQSFFMQGSVDNTTETAVQAWMGQVARIQPLEVHLYSLDRIPPAKGLTRASRDALDAVAARVLASGIQASVFA